MNSFTTLTSIAAPLMRVNIDTDTVIRIERMVGNDYRGTLGQWCFGALRYLADGSENPEFILNRAPYRDAEILIVGPNFGCGSSREAAVWSLQEMGIKAIIGSGFGDIFYNNCFQNGVLPVILDAAVVRSLAGEVERSQGNRCKPDAGFHPQQAGLSQRQDPGRRRQFRLRLEPRARAMGAA